MTSQILIKGYKLSAVLGTVFGLLLPGLPLLATPSNIVEKSSSTPSGDLLIAQSSDSDDAAVADVFGAVSTSNTTNAYGFSYDHSSREAAEDEALAQCSANAEDCEVRVWFKNSCGAVSDNGTHVGWGLGASREEAESKAMSALEDSGNLVAWGCTTR